MKLYHLSDLHLGVKPFYGSETSHITAVINHLEKVIKKAEEDSVKFILIAGDIFDSNAVGRGIVEKFFTLLSTYNHVNFILIPGGGSGGEEISGHDAYNHDSVFRRVEVKSFLELNPHIKLLTPDDPVAEFGNIAFYAGFFKIPEVSFIPGKKYHVGIFHGAYGNRGEFKEVALPTSFVKDYSYIALGHYHTFKRIAENAFYSGAFVQFEFIGGKRATSGYVSVKLGDSPEVEYIKIDAPEFIQMELLNDNNLKELEKSITSDSYVKILSYNEKYESALQELKSELGERLIITEGAKLEAHNEIVLDVLEDVLNESVPEEYRENVKEILLYGLQVMKQRKDFHSFINSKFGLEE